jgi:hypothetical protein
MSGWQTAILGGWQLNGIFQLATSRPYGDFEPLHLLRVASTVSYSGNDFT